MCSSVRVAFFCRGGQKPCRKRKIEYRRCRTPASPPPSPDLENMLDAQVDSKKYARPSGGSMEGEIYVCVCVCVCVCVYKQNVCLFFLGLDAR